CHLWKGRRLAITFAQQPLIEEAWFLAPRENSVIRRRPAADHATRAPVDREAHARCILCHQEWQGQQGQTQSAKYHRGLLRDKDSRLSLGGSEQYHGRWSKNQSGIAPSYGCRPPRLIRLPSPGSRRM